jgi:hypothetical protein
VFSGGQGGGCVRAGAEETVGHKQLAALRSNVRPIEGVGGGTTEYRVLIL